MKHTFQKPVTTDEDIAELITELYGLDNDGIKSFIKDSDTLAQTIKAQRLAGIFGEEAKDHFSHSELVAQNAASIGGEILYHRKEGDDFDPYEHYGVSQFKPVHA